MPVGWFSNCCTGSVESTRAELHQEMVLNGDEATQGNGGVDVLPLISFPGKRISQAKRRKDSQHNVEDWNNGSTDTILAFGIFHNVCFKSGWNASCGASKRWSFQQDHCSFLKEDIGLLLPGTGRRKVHVTLGRAHLAKGNSLKLRLKKGHILHGGLWPEASSAIWPGTSSSETNTDTTYTCERIC